MGRPLVDLCGNRFGRLFVVERAPDKIFPSGIHAVMYKCDCDCGKTVYVNAGSLKSGRTKSCGCLNKELVNKRCFKDLTGMIFGHLSVVEKAEDYIYPDGKSHRTKWKCICDLDGNEVNVDASNLITGKTTSCGCLRRQRSVRFQDLTGKRFGRLTVIELSESNQNILKRTMWKCRCDCGNETDVAADKLKSGDTQSCGCYQADRAHEENFENLIGQKFNHLTVIDCAPKKKLKEGNSVTMWKCRCDCGNPKPIDVWAADLKTGHVQSCGCIKDSLHEDYLKRKLNENDIPFKQNISFPRLCGVGGKPLSYDFGIYKNGTIAVLLECQGEQHYKPVELFGGEKQFEVQQEHDKRKKVYASDKGIDLIEIPYWYSYKKIDHLLNEIKEL